MVRRWGVVGVVFVVVLVLVWWAPRVVGLYDREEGGRLLGRAMAQEGRASVVGSWGLWEPLTQPEARSLAERARGYFSDAVAAGDVEAYGWLGRAWLLLGDAERAVEAFAEFVHRKPEARWGWWELGVAYDRLGEVDRAAEVWREGGIPAQVLIEVGEVARREKRYEEALGWYERATRVEPGLGDPWYYAGLAYEGVERWEEALEAYERAVGGRLVGVHGSSPYYRMGVIYQWRLELRQVDAALAAYERAIAVDDFRANWEAADCHYKRGLILRQQGVAPEEYVAEFERAVEIYPQHGMAHVMLGRAYYDLYGDVGMAEEEIRKALELNPQNKWAYLHLGDVYRQAGMCEEAEDAYRRALEIDEGFSVARERLRVLLDGC